MKDTFRTFLEFESAPVRLRASKQEFLLVIISPYRQSDPAEGLSAVAPVAPVSRKNPRRFTK